MRIRNMSDVREVLDKMASHNRVSVTGLNEIAPVGQGILTRLRRPIVPSRPRQGETTTKVEPDIKLSSWIKVVEAAGWEMVLQPATKESRRARARRPDRSGGGEVSDQLADGSDGGEGQN